MGREAALQLLDLALGEDQGDRLSPDRGSLRARREFAGTGAGVVHVLRKQNLGQSGRSVGRLLLLRARAVARRHFEPVERLRPVLLDAAPGLMEQRQIELRLGQALQGRALVPRRGLSKVLGHAAPGLVEKAQVELRHRVAPFGEREPSLRGLPIVAGLVGSGAVFEQVGRRRPRGGRPEGGCGEAHEDPCARALTGPNRGD